MDPMEFHKLMSPMLEHYLDMVTSSCYNLLPCQFKARVIFYHMVFVHVKPVPGKFLDTVGPDPNDSKSSRLLVDIFPVWFYSFGIYSIDSSKMVSNSPEVFNFNRLFLKLNRFICK